jgi:hypothetical protein
LIGTLLRLTVHPALGLALAKAAACGLAFAAWRGRRLALLHRTNVFFALCVAWNLAAIAAATVRR